ncbi:unnamed protein product [Coccothraustes coccothraustes]
MCCQCPRCAESSSRTAEAAAAQLHPGVWSDSRCGAVSPGWHIWGGPTTHLGVSAPTEPLPAHGTTCPQPPALAKVLKRPRRSAPQRAAATGCESISASKAPQQRES